jgi:8-oxo-dGTP pyrophosphatase MutT (NUDIX family)
VDKPGPARRRPVATEVSAGGIVVDRGAKGGPLALVIGRRSARRGALEWVIPKGHLEAGETPRQAAEREVAEETGITAVVTEPLGVVDYWFAAEERRVHKTVHHHLLEPVGGSLSTADREVEQVAWVPLADLPARLAYADERRIAQRALERLGQASPPGGPG